MEGVNAMLAQDIVKAVKSGVKFMTAQQLADAVGDPWSEEEVMRAIELLHDTNVLAYDPIEGFGLGMKII